MDAICMGWNQTTRRVVAGIVSVIAVALLAGGTATAAPRATLENSAQQASNLVASSSYFGQARTTAGYIPGL
jgi:hypothetical protein